MLAIMLRWLGPDSPLSIDAGAAFACAVLLLVCMCVVSLSSVAQPRMVSSFSASNMLPYCGNHDMLLCTFLETQEDSRLPRLTSSAPGPRGWPETGPLCAAFLT